MPAFISYYLNLGLGHDVYVVEIEGTQVSVTVTFISSVAEIWLHNVLNYYRNYRLVFGLGVQWTNAGGGPDPPADTLQLCVGQYCLIFHLCYANAVPLNLRLLLASPDNTFVGFWNFHDRRKLRISRHMIGMSSDPVDLRLHLESRTGARLSETSVRMIVREWLGYRVNQTREIRTSRWNVATLSGAQVIHACVDVYCAFAIGSMLAALGFIR